MIKIIAPAFIFLLLLSACSGNDQEIRILRKENAALKSRLDSYDDAIIITKDNIHKYVGALCYGPLEVKKNELLELQSGLYLHHLPVKVECKMDQENQSISEPDQISRAIENSFPGSGERLFSGIYTLTFPNGEKWSIPWQKQVVVK